MGPSRATTLVFAGFALRRLRRRWHLALATYFGLVVVVTLATSVTLVSTAAAGIGLQRTVRGLGPDGWVRIASVQSGSPGTPEPFARLTRGTVRSAVGPLLVPGAAYLQSNDLLPVSHNGQPVPHSAGGAPKLALYDALEQHVELVQGRFPGQPTVGQAWSATLSQQGAGQLGMDVGDRYCVGDFSGDSACLQIVGTWRARDPLEPWWGPDHVPNDALVVGPDAYQAVLKALPDAHSAAEATFTPDLAAFQRADLDQVLRGLRQLRGVFTVTRAATDSITTGLDAGLQDYADRLAVAQFAIQLLGAQILLIALLYLAFAGRHVLDQQRDQLAIWRSRGWRRRSVWTLLTLEFTVLSLLALPVGTPLGIAAAALVVRAIYGPVPVGELLVGVAGLWTPAAIAFGLGLAVLAGRAAAASRQGLREVGRQASRPPLRPWWQWRQLDLGFGLIGLALLVRVPFLAEGQTFDPTLLPLTGVAVLLLALLALRLLAPAARVAGGAGRGVALALAAWQLSRRPLQHSLLALLLLITVALGVFASVYLATQRQNADDRVSYAVGSDLRAVYSGEVQMPAMRPVVRQLKGVSAVSLVYRNQGQPGRAPLEPWVLGVEPSTFNQVAWSRPDLDTAPQADLVRRLDQPASGGGLELPGRPARIGLWVDSPGLTAEVTAAVEDAGGRPSELVLGTLDYTGWRYLDAPIRVDGAAPRFPLRLHELSIHQPPPPPATPGQPSPRPRYPFSGTMALSDLSVTLAGGQQPTVVSHLSDTGDRSSWYATRSEGGLTLGRLRANDAVLHDGRPATLVTPDTLDGEMTVRPVPDVSALPALAPTVTLDRLGISVGAPFPLTIGAATVAVVVVATPDHFPTLYPEARQDFLVVDRDALLTQLAFQGEPHAWPNEIWARTDGSADMADVKLLRSSAGIQDVQDRRSLAAATQADPLGLELAASLLIGFGAALALAAAAFGLHFLAAAAGRRGEYAILDANGLAPWTVGRSLALEQLVIVLFGVIGGLALGLLVAWLMLPVLHLGTSLQETVPPTVVTVYPWLIAAALTVLAVLALGAGNIAGRLGRGGRLMDELRTLG